MKLNNNVTINDNPLSINKWYTVLIVLQHGVIRYINITDRETYSSGAVPINTGVGTKPGTEDVVSGTSPIKRISVDRTTTMTVKYTVSGDDGGDDEIAIIPVVTAYQYTDNNVLVGTINQEFPSSPILIKSGSGTKTQSVQFTHNGYSIILCPGISNL